jgi:hypothetical protein
MQTRSQSKQMCMGQSSLPVKSTVVFSDYATRSKKTEYGSTDINFDDASKAWMKNKVKLGNGVYKYKSIESSNSFELRSPEFSRSPTASRPEIFAITANKNTEGITTRSGLVLVC